MDYVIFNVRTDANACDCTRECTGTVRESALKADPGGNLSCRTGEWNLRQRRAGPTLYQLSYIPSPNSKNNSNINKTIVDANGVDDDDDDDEL